MKIAKAPLAPELAIDNFPIHAISLPAAQLHGQQLHVANPTFYSFFRSIRTSPQEMLKHNRYKRTIEESDLVGQAVTEEIQLSNHIIEITVAPMSQPGAKLLFLRDVTLSAKSGQNNALLHRLSLLTSRTDEPLEDMLQSVVDHILFEFQSYDCSILVYDRHDGKLHQRAWGTNKLDSRRTTYRQTFSLGEGIVGTVAKRKKPFVIHDVSKDKRAIILAEEKDLHVSLMGVPITIGCNLLGVISVTRLTNQPRFSDSDLQLFQTIASRLALLIGSYREHEETVLKNRFTHILSETSSPKKKEGELLKILLRFSTTNRCQFLWWDDNETRLIPGKASGGVNRLSVRKIESLRSLVAAKPSTTTGNRIIVSEKLLTKAGVSDQNLIGSVIFPLKTVRRNFGLLYLPDGEMTERAAMPEAETISGLLSQFAVALENAEANEAILEERNRLDQIQRSLQDGLILYATDLRVAQVNPAAYRILGLKQSVFGLPWNKILKEDIANYAKYPLHRHFDPEKFLSLALEKGKVSTGFATIASKPPKIVEMTVGPVYSRQGKISGVLSHVRNITQVHDLQRKMASRVQQLTYLFKISSVGSLKEDRIVRQVLLLTLPLLNLKAAEFHHYDVKEQRYIGTETVGDTTLIKGFREDIGSALARVIDSLEPEPQTLKKPDDGEPVYVLTLPVYDQNQRRIGALVVADDEHRRYYSREEINILSIVASQIANKLDNAKLLKLIENDRDKLAAIIDQSVDGIFVTNPNLQIEIWNPALERMSGIKEEQVKNRNISEATKLARIEERVESERFAELRIRHAVTGKQLWIGVAYSPMVRNGKVTGQVAIVRDISRQKELEQARNDFVSTASHELRSPITAIMGYLSMLRRGDGGKIVDKQQAFFVEKAYKNAKRMVDIIEDLLLTTRVETGQYRFQIEPISPVKIIEGILSDLHFKSEEKQIRIELRNEGAQDILADYDAMHQVMSNLLTNAIKYTPAGGQILISFKRGKEEDQPYLITDITDTGVGIEESDYVKIFEKFSRVDNPLSVAAGGTGMGLYIVKTIVDQLGGRIWVTSKKGKGSTFSVAMPIYNKKGEINA